MNPTEVLYAVVSIAVLYFGTSAYKSYLENRKETRIKEVSDATQRETLEALKFTSAQETERTKIIAELAKKDSRIENIERLAFDTHTQIVKSMTAATEAKLDGIQLSPAISEALTHNARKISNEIRLDGDYRLLKIDWSNPIRFRVKVLNITTGLQLDAYVQDDSITGKYKDAIKTAEWSRKAIRLQIDAKVFGEDDYRDAVILSAELIESKE